MACNCRDELACPLPKLSYGSSSYKATVNNGDNVCVVYHFRTDRTFKQRYSGHKSDLKPTGKRKLNSIF